MYNVNLKNIVPSGDLTCLFAKATFDESNLWHRRLAHINFKTINKLVKGNLVRGLPIKVFENATKDETSPILKTFISGLENHLSLKGIKREFSVPRTPQQNGIAERKNKTLIEAARTILADLLLPIPFWAETVNTACYVQNRVLVTKPHDKTHYELLHGRTPSIGFMRPFGCPVTILNTLDSLGKFKGKVDEGFLEIKLNPVQVFKTNLMQKKAGEEINQQYVLFLVWSSGSTNPQNYDGDVAFDGKEHDFDAKKPESEVILSPSISAQSRKQDDKTKKEAKRKSFPTVGQNSSNSTNPFSAPGPSNTTASQTQGKSSFIDASQLFDDPDMPKLEDITYSDDEDDVGAEADFNNLKTSITPLGFEDPDHPDKVYKLVKALYGLHQAPRAWYETLANYLLENSFQKGKINQTLFIKKQKADERQVPDEFYGELTFFLGLQLKQKKDGIFISLDKNVADILRKFGLTEGKSASTPIDTEKPLLKDPDDAMDSESTARLWVNDVTRLQAIVDKKKVVVTEAAIREVLRLDDTKGVDYLPNEEIFIKLARMGYEKTSTTLTFYKAFCRKHINDDPVASGAQTW
nr:ribonuclease H-like domain-containing protein [Tanacetum cinerariifolium]